ncbi:MAG: hypothetical protein M1530_02255 [Candidatus Marsarchaeota archaeon]|nr:hypothetical protein [Candidatus Marsarchaeota archaeon]
MGRYYDVIEGLKTAWARWRDSELLKWVVLEFAGFIVLAVLAIGLLVAMVGPQALLDMMSAAGSRASGSQTASTQAAVRALAGVMVPFIAILLVLLLLYALACFFYFQPRIMRAALAAYGVKVPAKLPGMVDWLMLHIRLFFVNLACWYDKKLLVPAAAFIGLAIVFLLVSFVAGAAAIGAFIFAALGFMCWLVASIVHSIRTGFAPWMFLRGDGPEGKMPLASNGLVRGQTFEVFLSYFVFGILFGLAAMGVAIVRVILSLIPCIGPIFDMVINLAFNIFTQAYTNAVQADIFLFFDKSGPVKPANAPAKAPAKKK